MTSEHDTVRGWAAGALGDMQVSEAVPALQRAHQATRVRGDKPDWIEPVALRHVLTELGARTPMTPSLTASLCVTAPNGAMFWTEHRSSDTELVFSKPWPKLVIEAQQQATNEATQAQFDEHLLATIEWIGQADL